MLVVLSAAHIALSYSDLHALSRVDHELSLDAHYALSLDESYAHQLRLGVQQSVAAIVPELPVPNHTLSLEERIHTFARFVDAHEETPEHTYAHTHVGSGRWMFSNSPWLA